MRTNILGGTLPLPSFNKFRELLSKPELKVLESMWQALWHNFLTNEGSTSTPYWYDKWTETGGSVKHFNICLLSLSKAGWLTVEALPQRNWSDCFLNKDKLLEFVTEEEILEVRASFKVNKYLPKFKESTQATWVKTPKGLAQTGLIREGFALAGNTQFGYDTEALDSYKADAKAELVKGMAKLREAYPELKITEADYDSVAEQVLEDIIDNPLNTYTLGSNTSDSRGRAIYECLKWVGNPISFKHFRASLVITY